MDPPIKEQDVTPGAGGLDIMDHAAMEAILEEMRADEEMRSNEELCSAITQLCVIYRTIYAKRTAPDESSLLQLLPIDLWRVILELTVKLCNPVQTGLTGKPFRHERLQKSITFACVAWGWRAASLKMPGLWSSACMSLNWNPALVRYYWSCVGELVEEEPVSLVLFDVGGTSPITLNDINCTGMKFSNMDLYLKDPTNVTLFPPSWEELTIETQHRSASWKGCAIESMMIAVDKPDRIRHVEFDLEAEAEAEAEALMPCHMLFKNVVIKPHAPLLHLSLRRLGDLDMSHIFHAFPRLQTLDIMDCSFRQPSIKGINSVPELRVLRFKDNLLIDWFLAMEFPKLCELSLDEPLFFVNDLGMFLKSKSHQAIHTLALNETITCQKLQIAAACASQITTLQIDVMSSTAWVEVLIAPGAFPMLKQLVILSGTGGISQVGLDKLLAVRPPPTSLKREEGGGQVRISISWLDNAGK